MRERSHLRLDRLERHRQYSIVSLLICNLANQHGSSGSYICRSHKAGSHFQSARHCLLAGYRRPSAWGRGQPSFICRDRRTLVCADVPGLYSSSSLHYVLLSCTCRSSRLLLVPAKEIKNKSGEREEPSISRLTAQTCRPKGWMGAR